jgi:hypothetical protein
MAQVYRNALVTIAATASSSGTEGLFRRCSEYEVQGFSDSGEPYRLVFCTRIAHVGETVTNANIFPLAKRGWAFQERLISPRVLHFGPDELLFECVTTVQCECADPTNKPSRNIVETKSSLHSTAKLIDSETANTPFQANWQGLVQMYSTLKLTEPSDKLTACGGLAKMLARSNDQYLAGLWQSSFLEDLVWHVHSVFGPKTRSKQPWRAPSWSWASVDGQVIFNPWGEDSRETPYRFRVDLVDCITVPKGGDEFGQLVSGKLRLRGRCTPVTWVRGTAVHDLSNVYDEMSYILFPNGSTKPFHPDVQCESSTSERPTRVRHYARGGTMLQTRYDEGTIVCVFLGCLKFDNRVRIGLVLRQLDAAEVVYERIGLMLETSAESLDDDATLFPSGKTLVEIV